MLIAKRTDTGFWQGISGGGQDNETAIKAAQRELNEEASLVGSNWVQLDSKCMLPKIYYSNNEQWHKYKYVIPEYVFMTQVNSEGTLSKEHTEFCWLSIADASELVKYDSNRIALWEIEQRLINKSKALCIESRSPGK